MKSLVGVLERSIVALQNRRDASAAFSMTSFFSVRYTSSTLSFGVIWKLIIPLLLLLSLIPIRLYAQESPPIMVGIFGGISRGLLEGNASVYAGSPSCGEFTSGGTTSQNLGLQLILSDLFIPNFNLTLKPRLRRGTATLSQQSNQGAWIFNQEVGDATEIEREFQLQVETWSIEFGLLGAYRIDNRFSLGIGPTAGYNFSQKSLQTDRIVGPGDLSFADGQTRRTMIEGATYTGNPLSLGLDLIGNARLPITPRFSLLLELQSHLSLLSPVVEATWNSLDIGGNFGILYHLTPKAFVPNPPPFNFPPDPLPPPALQVLPDSALPKPRLNASLEIYSLEGDQRKEDIRVHFREADICTVVQIAEELNFADNSAELPLHYQEKSGEHLPELDSLVALDPLTLQNRVLELIGIRMKKNRAASLILQPGGKREELNRKRLENIRNYFVERWEVDPSRVESLPTSEDVGEGDVRITSKSSDIFAPVISRRLDRDFDAPTVKVKTSQEVEGGLRAWEITLSNDDDEIARYSSAQPESRGNAGIDWSVLYSDAVLDSSVIRGIFMVEDSTGARKIAHADAELIVQRSRIMESHVVDLHHRTETHLYWFSSSGIPSLDSLGYDDILRQFKTVVREGASVILVVGEEDSTRELSEVQTRFVEALQPYATRYIPKSVAKEMLARFGQCHTINDEIEVDSYLLVEQTLPQ
ncbi:MAG: hypothetical protein AB7H80_00800 [Candidatus Kapaibacterium sp.]